MNSDDLNFAYKVRHALNEHAEQLPSSTVDRLAAARKAAMARKKPDAPVRLAQRQMAGNIGSLFSFSTLGRMAVIVPLLALVVGLAGIYEYEEQQRISEMAELDAALLADDLPLTAYLDTGFNAYLEKRTQ
ncbi:DUF3619 family protein [Massilia sp. TSP1-1-2]|uniref:DUF3619 family protein n=1 Tax=unclassified Massilia TaxID=2609279 RepID=UPI003CED5267